MKKVNLERTKEMEELISDYVDAEREYYDLCQSLDDELDDCLKKCNLTDEEQEIVNEILDNDYQGKIYMLIYITNGEEKSPKDIVRQAYVYNGDPIPFEKPPVNGKVHFTREELKAFNELNMPYTVKEIQKELSPDYGLFMVMADYEFLEKLVKKTRKSEVKKLLETFMSKFMPTVPDEDVKEIHVYFPDLVEDLLFMDQDGLHKVAGKKAKIEFLSGNKIVGYIGSDFIDDDGDDCLGLFEAYEVERGFYDYHIYKVKDILRADVQFYREMPIDFKFDIKIRSLEKSVVGMTERKKKK